MSDVESGGSTQGTEAASSGPAAAETSGAGESAAQGSGPAAQAPAAPAFKAPKTISEKIQAASQAHKAKAAASGAKTDSGAILNTKTGAESPGDLKQPPVGGTPATPPPVAFAPNFKFRYKDKDHEIPELLRSAIKDADTEKAMREFAEKAIGIDDMKAHNQTLKTEHGQLVSGLNKLDGYIERDKQTQRPKDLGKFLSSFNLTDQDIFDYSQERLQYYKLPQDQRQRVDAEVAARDEATRLKEENSTLQTQHAELESQQRSTQLRSVMGHPQIAPVVQGHPGGEKGFYRDVATHAWLHEQATEAQGKREILSPEQAVLSYIQQRGLGAAPAPVVPGQAPAPQAPGVVPPVAQERAPTIPTVASTGTSPAKQPITNLKSLKAARDKAIAAQT